MISHSNWSYRPYAPHMRQPGTPYICRIAPGENEILFEWLPEGDTEEYTVLFGKRDGNMEIAGRTKSCAWRADGLEADTEYQFQVVYAKGESRFSCDPAGFLK